MKKWKRNLKVFLLLLLVGAMVITWILNHVGDFVAGFVEGFAKAQNDGTLPEGIGTVAEATGVVLSILLCLLLLFLIFGIIRKNVSDPLQRISQSMEEVRNGNLDAEMETDDAFEFGSIEKNFNSMVKGLREARDFREENAEKNRKLYAEIAHDLKTPMTMILGYAKLLAGDEIGERERKAYALTIAEQTENANSLLEQMLEYAKLGSTEYRLEKNRTNIAELLRQTAAESYFRFEERGMELEADIPEDITAECDVTQMKRVFLNLIGNILKHNPEGTKVKLAMRQNAAESGIEMIFADNGPLIEGELKEQLFDAFRTGDESRNSKGGSGLGLSVAKKIAVLHGGDLEYRDEVLPGFKGFVLTIQGQK